VIYRHLDKQPPGDGWTVGGPRTPTLEDGRLYGRGAADDGYASFVALAALRAIEHAGLPAARCVLVLQTSEESGSGDLLQVLDPIGKVIGTPSAIVVLDSICHDLDRLWLTTSPRGGLTLDLTVATLTQAAHSGGVGGLAPSPIVVAGALLARLAPVGSDWVSLDALGAEVPEDRRREAERLVSVLGRTLTGGLRLRPGVQPTDPDPVAGLLRTTWQSVISVIGVDGIPAVASAPNAIPGAVTLRLSLRFPPTVAPHRAAETVLAAVPDEVGRALRAASQRHLGHASRGVRRGRRHPSGECPGGSVAADSLRRHRSAGSAGQSPWARRVGRCRGDAPTDLLSGGCAGGRQECRRR